MPARHLLHQVEPAADAHAVVDAGGAAVAVARDVVMVFDRGVAERDSAELDTQPDEPADGAVEPAAGSVDVDQLAGARVGEHAAQSRLGAVDLRWCRAERIGHPGDRR